MLLLDRILDDGMSSRLWQRLVENKGLCYELWASIDSYSDTSIFEVGASVAPDKVLPLVEGIYNELKRLRDDGPSDEEFDLARRRLQFGEEFVLDKVSELNERLGSHVLYGPAISIQEQMQRIANLTKDDVVQTANQLFQESNQLLTAVGPLTKSTKRKLRELAKIL
jgi:predicted Zn-dependent peptidase